MRIRIRTRDKFKDRDDGTNLRTIMCILKVPEPGSELGTSLRIVGEIYSFTYTIVHTLSFVFWIQIIIKVSNSTSNKSKFDIKLQYAD